MKLPAMVVACSTLCVLMLAACNPALNWRQVNLQTLKARLPCKPDSATRTVPLAGRPVEMQMMGCEADGAMFAISHVRTDNKATAMTLQAEWQVQALKALQATYSHPVPLPAAVWANTRVSIRTAGKDTAGKPMQAQLSWWVRDAEIYHLAVYSEHLPDTMTQAFLEDVSVQ